MQFAPELGAPGAHKDPCKFASCSVQGDPCRPYLARSAQPLKLHLISKDHETLFLVDRIFSYGPEMYKTWEKD